MTPPLGNQSPAKHVEALAFQQQMQQVRSIVDMGVSEVKVWCADCRKLKSHTQLKESQIRQQLVSLQVHVNPN